MPCDGRSRWSAFISEQRPGLPLPHTLAVPELSLTGRGFEWVLGRGIPTTRAPGHGGDRSSTPLDIDASDVRRYPRSNARRAPQIFWGVLPFSGTTRMTRPDFPAGFCVKWDCLPLQRLTFARRRCDGGRGAADMQAKIRCQMASTQYSHGA